MLDTIGWVYFLNNRVDEAQSVLGDALRMDPSNASVQYHLGEMYHKAGRASDARALFTQALELAKESKNVELADKIQQALDRAP